MILVYSLQLEKALIVLVGSLLDGPMIKGLEEVDHLQYPHHIPRETRACSILAQPLLAVQHRSLHRTHRQEAFIPGSTTLRLTQMRHFRDPRPTPHTEEDCIPQAQNPQLLQWNTPLTGTQGVRFRTPRKATCLIQVPWTKFGEEEFNDLKARPWFKIHIYRLHCVYCNNFVGREEFYEDIRGNGRFHIGAIKDFLFTSSCSKIPHLARN